MNRKIAVMLLILWGGILIALIVHAFNSPSTFINQATNPTLSPDQMFSGINQFMHDMTSNLSPPK